MQPWAWVLLLVVLVVLILLAVAVLRWRRTAELRERFGPEYDRTVEASDGRGDAEHALLDRAKRRDRLEIRPLPEAARARYAEQWRGIQERFVDDPGGSVGAAHALLDQVMGERGYPTRDFEEQADLVSVDHPQVVENYRAAYAVHQRQRDGQATTEDLRDALVRYRSLFEELLHPGSQDATDATDRTPATNATDPTDGTDTTDAPGARDEPAGVPTEPAGVRTERTERTERTAERDATLDVGDDEPTTTREQA